MTPSRSAVERRVLDAVDPGAATALVARLVETPSFNPPGDESGVTSILADALAAEQIPVHLDDVFPGRPNLAAALGDGEGPTLLLNGHTDTMPAGTGWESLPHRPAVSGGRLYGLGSCDMKAGLAAMTEALRAIKRAGVELRGCVRLDAVVDEEGTGAGTKHVVSRGRRADWAIIAEPTELTIANVGNGQVNYDVVFRGAGGHGSTPEVGHNAIYDAAAFVAAVEEEAARVRARPHPVVGPGSYNIGVIEGGVRTSIIPAHCTVGVDRRIVPGQTPADAHADLDRLLKVAAQGRPAARADWTVTVEYPPFDTRPDLAVCQALQAVMTELTGRAPAWRGLRATTDAAFLAAGGIPAVVFGPGSLEQAHAPNEYVELHQLEVATRALALVAVRLLA